MKSISEQPDIELERLNADDLDIGLIAMAAIDEDIPIQSIPRSETITDA